MLYVVIAFLWISILLYLLYLLYEDGKEDELLGKLQKKLGKTRQEVEDEVSSWSK